MSATTSRCLLAVLLATFFGPAVAEVPQLSMPVVCELGRSCFIQHYADIEPGDGIRDHACGEATYEAHKGTDFRLVSGRDVPDGVRVLAAAPGIVKGVRDGMQDAFAWAVGRAATAGKECGNGVTIDHGNGWETQYCHLREGSVRVRKGERIGRGEHIGDVGFSGQADFAHLHFEVRRNGRFVDPFIGADPDLGCGRDMRLAALWDDAFRQSYRYRESEFVGAGFAAAAPDWKQLETGGVRQPEAGSPALVFFARAINMRAGDRVRLRVDGPSGFALQTVSEPLDRRKPIWIAYAGRRLTAAAWPAGIYTGTAELLRGDATVATTTAETTIHK